jgi:hypothetical protein
VTEKTDVARTRYTNTNSSRCVLLIPRSRYIELIPSEDRHSRML